MNATKVKVGETGKGKVDPAPVPKTYSRGNTQVRNDLAE